MLDFQPIIEGLNLGGLLVITIGVVASVAIVSAITYKVVRWIVS